MDSIFAQRPEVYVDGELLGTALRSDRQRWSADRVDVTDDPLLSTDTVLINGTPGETTGTYFVPGDDTLGTSWTADRF